MRVGSAGRMETGLASGGEPRPHAALGVGAFIDDEGGYTTVAMAVALLVSISLVFSAASAQWVFSRAGEVQQVADAAAESGAPLRASWRTPKTGCHTPGAPFRSHSGRNRTSRRFLPTRMTRVWRTSRARCGNLPSASARRRSARTMPGSAGGGLTAARARTACGNGPSRSRVFPTARTRAIPRPRRGPSVPRLSGRGRITP